MCTFLGNTAGFNRALSWCHGSKHVDVLKLTLLLHQEALKFYSLSTESTTSLLFDRGTTLFNWNVCLATLAVTPVWEECINNSCIKQDPRLNILTQIQFSFFFHQKWSFLINHCIKTNKSTHYQTGIRAQLGKQQFLRNYKDSKKWLYVHLEFFFLLHVKNSLTLTVFTWSLTTCKNVMAHFGAKQPAWIQNLKLRYMALKATALSL